VATKYPRTATWWFDARGQAVEVVRLHGSVELAPQVGLVDAIVDLTASGQTLRENRLRVAGILGSSTARLVANQASLKTRTDAIQALVFAAQRIRDFHRAQVQPTSTGSPGMKLISRAVARAGVYAPGGRAAYPSTVLMTAIPARVAGVKEVVLATPPRADGSVPASI